MKSLLLHVADRIRRRTTHPRPTPERSTARPSRRSTLLRRISPARARLRRAAPRLKPRSMPASPSMLRLCMTSPRVRRKWQVTGSRAAQLRLRSRNWQSHVSHSSMTVWEKKGCVPSVTVQFWPASRHNGRSGKDRMSCIDIVV